MLYTIDCDYIHPKVASAYLLEDAGEVAFIETNTTHAVPALLAALERAGRSVEDVRWVIITHIHLDHAGGAGALMAACPNATLLAHPRAAPHAIDPARIVKGATAVYGQDRFRELYGEISPIDAGRVRSLDDGATVDLGGRTLQFLHTRGHANHHFCVLDASAGGCFTGDSFGIVYPDLQHRGLFAFPSTSPTDFDGPAALETLRRIRETGVDRVWLTHFGEQTAVADIAAQCAEMLERSVALVSEVDASGREGEDLDAHMQSVVRGWFEFELDRRHLTADPARSLLELDIDLNAQGLAFAVRKRRFKKSQTSVPK